MYQRFKLLLLGSVLAILFLSVGAQFPVMAQTGATTGAIAGTIKDATGATLAGATFKIKNIETNIVQEVSCDENGNFTVTNLPPSVYEITIVIEGFKPQTVKVP